MDGALNYDGSPVLDEEDPVFSASPAAGITEQDLIDFATAFGWGDHAEAGYLKTLSGRNATELDDITSSGSGSIITADERSDISENTSARHSHSNKGILDSIQEAFTTALKNSYDAVVGWVNQDVRTSASPTFTGVNVIDSNEGLKITYDGTWTRFYSKNGATEKEFIKIRKGADMPYFSNKAHLEKIGNDTLNFNNGPTIEKIDDETLALTNAGSLFRDWKVRALTQIGYRLLQTDSSPGGYDYRTYPNYWVKFASVKIIERYGNCSAHFFITGKYTSGNLTPIGYVSMSVQQIDAMGNDPEVELYLFNAQTAVKADFKAVVTTADGDESIIDLFAKSSINGMIYQYVPVFFNESYASEITPVDNSSTIDDYSSLPAGTQVSCDYLALNADSLNVNDTEIIDSDGFFKPVSSADGSAPNNSVYYSTTQSKLVYKDSSGTVNDLF